MAITYDIYYLPSSDPGVSVFAFPIDGDLSNYSTNRVQLNQDSAPNSGRFHNTVTDPSTYSYAIFHGTSQPSSWEERKDVVSVLVRSDVKVVSNQASNNLVSAIWSYTIENGYSALQAFRLALAALAGKVSGGGTSQVTFRDTADSKDRIVADVDQDGNRTSITYDET